MAGPGDSEEFRRCGAEAAEPSGEAAEWVPEGGRRRAEGSSAAPFPPLFSGFCRSQEMATIVSALSYVVAGEKLVGGGDRVTEAVGGAGFGSECFPVSSSLGSSSISWPGGGGGFKAESEELPPADDVLLYPQSFSGIQREPSSPMAGNRTCRFDQLSQFSLRFDPLRSQSSFPPARPPSPPIPSEPSPSLRQCSSFLRQRST